MRLNLTVYNGYVNMYAIFAGKFYSSTFRNFVLTKANLFLYSQLKQNVCAPLHPDLTNCSILLAWFRCWWLAFQKWDAKENRFQGIYLGNPVNPAKIYLVIGSKTLGDSSLGFCAWVGSSLFKIMVKFCSIVAKFSVQRVAGKPQKPNLNICHEGNLHTGHEVSKLCEWNYSGW